MKNAQGAMVTRSFTIRPRDEGGLGRMMRMRVKDKSIPQADLRALVTEAHEMICPYSHATRGNVPVELLIEGA